MIFGNYKIVVKRVGSVQQAAVRNTTLLSLRCPHRRWATYSKHWPLKKITTLTAISQLSLQSDKNYSLIFYYEWMHFVNTISHWYSSMLHNACENHAKWSCCEWGSVQVWCWWQSYLILKQDQRCMTKTADQWSATLAAQRGSFLVQGLHERGVRGGQKGQESLSNTDQVLTHWQWTNRMYLHVWEMILDYQQTSKAH